MKLSTLTVIVLGATVLLPARAQEAPASETAPREVPTLLTVPWDADKATIKAIATERGYKQRDRFLEEHGGLIFEGDQFAGQSGRVKLDFQLDKNGQVWAAGATLFVADEQGIAEPRNALLRLLMAKYGVPDDLFEASDGGREPSWEVGPVWMRLTGGCAIPEVCSTAVIYIHTERQQAHLEWLEERQRKQALEDI